MGRKYTINDQQAVHFVTFTLVYWLDLFIRDEYRQAVLDSLQHCRENKALKTHAYCIMTSHIHLILSSEDDLSGQSISLEPSRHWLFGNPTKFTKPSQQNMMVNCGFTCFPCLDAPNYVRDDGRI